jgi:hypothetical protein
MSASPLDPTLPASRHLPYPRLSDTVAEAVHQKLLDIISLLHDGRLTEDQLDEIKAGLSLQNANTEALHRFPLSNADGPAYALSLNRMPTRDR